MYLWSCICGPLENWGRKLEQAKFVFVKHVLCFLSMFWQQGVKSLVGRHMGTPYTWVGGVGYTGCCVGGWQYEVWWVAMSLCGCCKTWDLSLASLLLLGLSSSTKSTTLSGFICWVAKQHRVERKHWIEYNSSCSVKGFWVDVNVDPSNTKPAKFEWGVLLKCEVTPI